MNTRVPLVDLGAQQREVHDDVMAGLAAVFESTAFVGGPQVGAFEREYASFVQSAHCVGVANGTDALELALRAVGVEPGTEVVLPANTFIATAEAVARLGARPVLVDVDDEHLLIDPAHARAAVTRETRAVVPVHLFGQAAAVERVVADRGDESYAVLEDAAQAQGAMRLGKPAGSLGDAAATSFYPGKNLGAAGDAGAVTTDDPGVADLVRTIAAHGSRQKYVHDVVGCNSRLDTVQAVVLSAKLRRLADWNQRRRAAAERYRTLLQDLDGVRLPGVAAGNEHVWHLYVVRVDNRDEVLRRLNEAGVGAGIHYPTPVHLTGAFSHLGLGRGAFPVAERASAQLLSLPLFPHITEEQQVHVADTLAAAVDRSIGGPVAVGAAVG